MKVWVEENKVKCLSEMCTEDCPRFCRCQNINKPEELKQLIKDLSKERQED